MTPSKCFAAAFLCAATVAAQVSNNECSAPIVIDVGINPAAPFGMSGATFTNTGATLSAAFANSDCGTVISYHDVFFQFTATCSGSTRVSTCAPPGFAAETIPDSVLSVYSTFDCAIPIPAAPIACNDDACGLLSEVTVPTTAGASYLVRVGSYHAGNTGTFYLRVQPLGSVNDEFANALPLGLGANAATTECSSPSVEVPCPGTPVNLDDVWNVFTPSANGLLTVALSGSGASSFAIMNPTSGGLVVVGCGYGSPSSVTLFAAAGTSYYVRSNSLSAGLGPFQLDVALTSGATSDECAGAVAIFDGVNPASPNGYGGFTFSNVGATDSPGFAAPCAGNGGGHSDVFFNYTSTIDGPVKISTCAPPGFVAGTLNDTVLTVYPASACSGPIGAPIACNDDACGLRSLVTFPAVFGVSYLIRVASYDASQGGFYLTVDPRLNSGCNTAQAIAAAGQVHGVTLTLDPGLPVSSTQGAFYTFTAPTGGDLLITIDGPAVFNAEILGNACVPFGLAFGGVTSARFPDLAPGALVVIRVPPTLPSVAFALTLEFYSAPPNDDCQTAIPLVVGVNPPLPTPGSPGPAPFTNRGANQTVGPFASTGCNDPTKAYLSDVFFTYVAECDGPVSITTTPPPGSGLSGFDAAIFVHTPHPVCAGSPVVACNDDYVGSVYGSSLVQFSTVAGTTYLIRVASALPSIYGNPSPTNGLLDGAPFRLTVTRGFCLTMDGPAGPGSLRIRNMGGPPGAPYISIFTLYGGNYPQGAFFGINPTFTEIILQVTSGNAPFVGVLDASGASTFGTVAGLPPLAVYGVSLALNALGQIELVSAPESFQIL